MEWTTIITLAIIIETITENLKNAIPKFKEMKWAVMLTTLALGVLLAFVCGADILALLGYVEHIPYVGVVLTGILIGGGSNVIYDLVNRIKGQKETMAASLEIPEGNTTIAGHEDTGVM